MSCFCSWQLNFPITAINAMTSVTLYIAKYLCKPKAVEFLSAAKADKVANIDG
jgi:hypothetical protein